MIHKEGIKTLTALGIFLITTNIAATFLLGTNWLSHSILLLSLAGFLGAGLFFRKPQREKPADLGQVIAPADGVVIKVDRIFVEEYFNDYRQRVSIFMSGRDVHINWVPLTGHITYQRYNPGRHFLAKLPKSSDLNERSCVVIKDQAGREVMVRQIAGIIARRVVTYPKPGEAVAIGDELGFIKFGSRVDLFFPPGTNIKVSQGQKSRGQKTILTDWNS
ncbi:MAG: phosphatidylserine decarboxylase family protein [Bacteroidales bacterium]|jgi:phosphatidylserine decarboxylase